MHPNVRDKQARQVLVPFPKDHARRAVERSVEHRLEKAIDASRRMDNAASLLPEFIALVDLGCSEANYFVGCLLEEGGPNLPKDLKSAVFYYQKAVEEIGYLEAALALARVCYYGIGVPVDTELAAQYYKTILALKPHPVASLMLGRMHRLGQGVSKDLKRAEELLEQAVEADNVYAIRELAMLRRQQKRWILALLLGLKAGWRAFRIGLQDLHDPRLRQA